MKHIISTRHLLAVILVIAVKITSAQDNVKFPIPSGNPNQLFYLQRTPNANTVVYELNLKDGKLDSLEPVHIFWIRYGEKSQKTELNYIQWKFAYGISARSVSNGNYEIHFLSYKKFVMHLMKGMDNKYNIYTLINQKQAILSKIYLQISGGTFWLPNIEYVVLTGIDPATGSEVYQKLKI